MLIFYSPCTLYRLTVSSFVFYYFYLITNFLFPTGFLDFFCKLFKHDFQIVIYLMKPEAGMGPTTRIEFTTLEQGITALTRHCIPCIRDTQSLWCLATIFELHGRTLVLASVEPIEYRHAPQCLVYLPHSCIRVMVPDFPHMAWVGPGEGTFTC